jgi:SRSO17 transposase
LRVRAAHRDERLKEPREEEWLLIEWPEGAAEPTKYWLATLLAGVAFAELIDLAKLRWRIERDYQELKRDCQESCARSHSVKKERLTWQSTRNFWTSFWKVVTRRSCLLKTVCWTT